MIQTVEAVVDSAGRVRLLGEVRVGSPRRALVTVLEEPAAVPGEVPPFVRAVLRDGDLAHGTIVLLDRLDRLTWKTSSAMKENLLHHVGLIYREIMRSVPVISHVFATQQSNRSAPRERPRDSS